MKVILNKDVPKLGQKYDVKTVTAGYARNFLIPGGLADIATDKNIKVTEKRREERKEKKKIEMEVLEKEIGKLSDVKITLKEKTNDKGHLFAQIHTSEIAVAIKEELGLDIEPSLIYLENPIKEVGEFKVEIKIGDKKAKISLTVEEQK